MISHITKETFISIHIINTSEKNHHWCLTIMKYKQHFDVAYQISLSRKSLLLSHGRLLKHERISDNEQISHFFYLKHILEPILVL